jgi:hypothetical protein
MSNVVTRSATWTLQTLPAWEHFQWSFGGRSLINLSLKTEREVKNGIQ